MNPTLPGPSAEPPSFTASRIAAALGVTKRAVLLALVGVQPTSQIAGPGGLADAWLETQLPERLRRQLADTARHLGYRDAASLLSVPPGRWEPEIPLPVIAQRCIDEAIKLREALSRALQSMDLAGMKAAELERMAAEDHARVFGRASHPLSARQIRYLLRRTIVRDQGAEDWPRLEIYLPDRLARKTPADARSAPSDAEFSPLSDLLATFANPAAPSRAEEPCLLLRAFELLAESESAGRGGPDLKRRLIDFLCRRAAFLAPNAGALRRDFNRKFKRWSDAGQRVEAVADRRAAANAKRRLVLTDADRDAIVGTAIFQHDGTIEPAIRDALKDRRLSEPLAVWVDQHPDAIRRLVRAVGPEVGSLHHIHRGPRAHRLNGAYILRDWSGVAAGDWYTSDDCTLPVYYYLPDGSGWFTLTRGQFLPLMDLRSKRILDFVLLDSKSYSAASIRTLITKGADRFGLPRHGFAFERGIWEKSRLLKGVSNAAATWSEVETGLRGLGLKFQHSNLPRSKPIENVLGLLQNLMEGEPGYVGRNEQVDKFERVQKAKLDVEHRRIHPAEAGFYSAEEWFERLQRILERYNAEPQGGKMTLGMAPDDAWETFQKSAAPLVRLPASCRYLLATHCREAPVGPNGISFKFGKIPLVYRSAETAARIGQRVIVWFDPEFISSIAVTDMKRENPFTAERVLPVPAMDATREDMASAQASVAAQNKFARARYSQLRAKFIPPGRRVVSDTETPALGDAFRQGRADAVARMDQQRQQVAQSDRIARQVGIAPVAQFQGRVNPDLASALKEFMSAPDGAEVESQT